MNDKVYLITTGSYSDYTVRAVTESKERAIALRDLFSKYGDYTDIEEFILDEARPEQRRQYSIKFVNGMPRVMSFDPTPGNDAPTVIGPYQAIWGSEGGNEIIFCEVLALDEDHALKIAEDEYARYKAEKEGIT